VGDFDAGRVKAVKAAIDQGTFTVDAEAIADKMLSNAQEIFSRSRG
jgi:negative regulator of flagellin synthesis FlgM